VNLRDVALAAPPRLRARTERFRGVEDLLDHLGRDDGLAWLDGDSGFVTAGVAAVVEPAAAVRALSAIDHTAADDVPESGGPRAVGALPFAGDGRMVIPARTVARDTDGRTWCTTVTPAVITNTLTIAHRRPGRFAVSGTADPAAWERTVATALTLVDTGGVDKVVLARQVEVTADAPFDVRDVLAQLRRTQPGCTVYADGGFVGASPEVLVRRRGADVWSRPLAGTITRDGDDDAEIARLLASDKDGREHAYVVDAVVSVLGDVCTRVHVEGPSAMTLSTVTHLATTVAGRLRDLGVSAVDLALALHPTPAVGGWPRAAALRTIEQLEPTGRGRYAGPCGWVDANGDGEFVVALRGADIDGTRAVLHAGAGIVAGSDPEAEWLETQAKLEPMLRVLIRP
jgi:menaquinone-specific isochorismate synthase